MNNSNTKTPRNLALEIAQEFVTKVHVAIQQCDWKQVEGGLCFCRELSRDELDEIAHSPVYAQALIVENCTMLLSTSLRNYVMIHIVAQATKNDSFKIELHIGKNHQENPVNP